MSLNGGGVGITFQGRDKGFMGVVNAAGDALGKMAFSATFAATDVTSSFVQMGQGIGSALSTTTEAVSTFVRGTGKWLGKLGFGFTVVKQAFGSFVGMLSGPIDAVKGLMGAFDPTAIMDTAGQIGEITNLTSNLEAEAVSTGKSAREMGAQMGYTGDRLEKFTKQATSMAMALNVGPDEAAKAIRAWDEAAEEMRALGFQNAQDIVKFTTSFGVEADTLRNSTLMMRKEFGLTDKEINNVIGSAVEMGKATGDVPSALNELSQHMERMREQARGMGVDLDGKKLANFAAQANALAAGLFQMGQDSDTARAAAHELSTALIDAEKDFHNMFAGTQQELPEFVKELAITTGDAESAFKMMKAGPAGFVKGMAEMVATAKSQGTLTAKNLDFVGARMEQVLGAEAAARLVGFMRTADANTIRMMGNVENATADLRGMGKEAFRTGRTMQENFERMMMAVGDNFRRAGKKEVREWMHNIRDAVKDANKKIGSLAKDDGPLGEFTRKLAAAEHIGIQAFLPPSLQQGSIVLGQFSKQLGPVIDQMKQLGISFSIGGLIKGAMVGVSLFATQVALAKEEGEDWGTAIKRTANTISGELVGSIQKWGGVFQEVVQAFADYDWSQLWSGIGDSVDSQTGPIGKIRNAFSDIFDSETMNNLHEGWNKMWSAVESTGVIEKAKATWGMIVDDVIKPAFMKMMEILVEDVPWGKIGEAIVKGTFEGVGNVFSDIGKEFEWSRMKGSLGLGGDDEAAKRHNKILAGGFEDHAKRMGRRAALEEHARNFNVETAAIMDNMGKEFYSLATTADDSFSMIEKSAEDKFGNSVHTFVEEDMKQATDAFAGAAAEFERLWHEAWLNVLEDMDIGVAAIEVSAGGVLSKLQQIAQAKDDIAEARGGMDSPAQASERDLRIRSAVGDQATHAPEWYRGSTGYEALFTRKMDRLIAGVERMGVNVSAPATPSPAAAARAKLQANRAARTATGGATQPATTRSGRKI